MRVKVCGNTAVETALVAVDAGADALGFIMAPDTPRSLTPERARAIVRALPADVDAVGVFVDRPVEEVAEVAAEVGFTVVQLHGTETWEQAEHLHMPVIKGVRLAAAGDAAAVAWPPGNILLADSHDPGLPGGTGRAFPWTWAADLALRYRLVLSGGLGADNVAAAIDRVRPWGVDASSRLESSPGSRTRRGCAPSWRPRAGPRPTWVLPARRRRAMAEPTGAAGRFGPFGGQYVPETLMPALHELEQAYAEAQADPGFAAELGALNRDYGGRPTPLYHAERLSEEAGTEVWFKREDLLHTGAHKLNNALGQVLLARRMGKTRIIAETGAGQHGVATATVCARFGMTCLVYMGVEDMRRQALNVYKMRLLGAEVEPVETGSQTLKDATNEAIRDWVTNVRDTHYIIGSAVGPHPYPTLVRDFQSVIGREARAQFLERNGRLPGHGAGLRRRGQQRHRHLPRLHPRRRGAADRARGRRAGGRQRQARGLDPGRPAGGAARLLQLPAPGRRRPGRRDPLHQRRAGLPRRGPRAQPAQGHRPRHLRGDHRPRGARRLPPDLPAGGHHPRAGELPRHRPRPQGRPRRARLLVCLSGRGDKDIDTVRGADGPAA